MSIRCLSMLLTSMLVCLTACGSTPTAKTRIDPASTSVSDHFDSKLATQTKTTKLTIAPPVAPVAATVFPATPVDPPAGVSTVAITQAPVPVSVDVGGRKVTAPAGSTVTLELSDVGTPEQTIHDRAASAAGATYRGENDKGDFNAGAPKVDLPAGTNTGPGGSGSTGGGGGATGGGTQTAWDNVVAAIATASGRISFWLAAFGILCLLSAVVMIIVEHIIGGATDWALVGILAAAGVACMAFAIVADTHPWVIVVLGLLIVAGVVGYVLWWKFGKSATTVPAPLSPVPATPTPTPGTTTTTTTTPAAPTAFSQALAAVESEAQAVIARLKNAAAPAPTTAPIYTAGGK